MACCIRSKESKPLSALEIPRDIDLATAEQLMSAFNNHFIKLFKQHVTVKDDALADSKDNKKGSVSKAGFRKILKQAHKDLETQCSPAILGRYNAQYARVAIFSTSHMPQNANRRKLLRSLSRTRVVTVMEQRAVDDVETLNCLIDQCIEKEDFQSAELLKRRSQNDPALFSCVRPCICALPFVTCPKVIYSCSVCCVAYSLLCSLICSTSGR